MKKCVGDIALHVLDGKVPLWQVDYLPCDRGTTLYQLQQYSSIAHDFSKAKFLNVLLLLGEHTLTARVIPLPGTMWVLLDETRCAVFCLTSTVHTNSDAFRNTLSNCRKAITLWAQHLDKNLQIASRKWKSLLPPGSSDLVLCPPWHNAVWQWPDEQTSLHPEIPQVRKKADTVWPGAANYSLFSGRSARMHVKGTMHTSHFAYAKSQCHSARHIQSDQFGYLLVLLGKEQKLWVKEKVAKAFMQDRKIGRGCQQRQQQKLST